MNELPQGGETEIAMPRPKRGRQSKTGVSVAIGLALLAVFQTVGIVSGRNEAALPDLVAVGDDLSPMPLQYDDGTVAPLDPQHPMLLLIFDPDCVHTLRVAPLWSSWLASGEAEGLTVLAIAPAPVAAAAEYARNQQWWVGVAAAVGSEEQPGGHLVTRRTPWVVAVDASGRVVREAHGAKLAEVAHELLDTR